MIFENPTYITIQFQNGKMKLTGDLKIYSFMEIIFKYFKVLPLII